MNYPMPRFSRLVTVSLSVAGVANLIILSSVPLLFKSIAVLILTGLLPGALLVEWLVGQSDAPPPAWEQILYSVGAGYSNMVIVTLALSYLPGGLSRNETLLTFDLLLLLLVLPLWLRRPSEPTRSFTHHSSLITHHLSSLPWLWLGLLSLCLVGGFFRFTNLGYAEFQGDEARLTLRAAEVLQGDENVLFIHQKGPTEILLPTVLYALTDRLTETTARLPFAIANFTALFAIFLLGRRLFGVIAGWAAAMLLALDGYMIGFARVVQYQSIVLLMVILVVLIFYRSARAPKALPNYVTLAALLLATGLLSHYEAALVMFPVAYLSWRIWRQGMRFARALIIPVLLGGLILASFYAPFMLKPSFNNTYHYLTGYRMGGGTYNNLADFFNRTTVYSSAYYFLTLVSLAVIGLLLHFWRNLTRLWRWLAATIVISGMGLTFYRVTWLTFGHTDLIWVFFVASLLGAWLMPKFSAEERTVWLWFGVPMILALFFTAVPNTHVYSFFIAWALLAGLVIARGWQALSTRLSVRTAQMIAVPIALGVILIFGLYENYYFVYNKVEVLRTWKVNRPKSYWTPYDLPTEIAIFGFPLNNGWKAVAALYDAGILQGNYATNTRETVAEWYTRGTHNCARDVPNYYMLANPVEPGLAAATAKLRQQVQNDHELFGTILVHGNPGLEIYKLGKTGIQPQQFALEQYAAHFDKTLAGPNFEHNGPVGKPAIQHPLNIRFGDAIWLKGYRLEQTETTPGSILALTLYWQATQLIAQDYFVFVQAIDLKDFHKAGQRDGQPGCNNYPTTTWLPGDTIADHYTLPIELDAVKGEYTLITGLYIGNQRLEMYTADGQPAGNQLELTQIHVQPTHK